MSTEPHCLSWRPLVPAFPVLAYDAESEHSALQLAGCTQYCRVPLVGSSLPSLPPSESLLISQSHILGT